MARRDEFDDDDTFLDSILKQNRHGHPGSLRRVLAVTAGLATLGILGAVMWSTLSDDSSGSADAVPIIRADAGDYKEAPSEPGGMAVPNKDSTIFESLKGPQASDQAKLENLFEDAETPVRKDEVFTAENATPPAEPPEAAKDVVSKMPKMPTVTYESPETSEATPPVNLRPPQTDAEEQVAAVKSAPVTAAPVPIADAPKPKAVEQSEEIAAAAPKAAAIQPAAGGNFYVQMAAVKSEADARKQWPTYQAKYNQLSDLSLRVQEADLGAKGTYYRIQGGPLTEADARKVCSSINSQKSGSCVVAKR